MVVRAKAILLAAQGLRNDQIADRISLRRQTSASGANASSRNAWAVWKIFPVPGVRPFFPLNWSCRSKPWRANCPINTVCLCPASAVRTWSGKSSAAGLVASISGRTLWRWLTRTPSVLGSTAVGFSRATRISSTRRSACWTSTKDSGKTKGWEPMITSFRPMKRPAFKPASPAPHRAAATAASHARGV